MIGRLAGTLDAEAAEQLADFIEIKEELLENGFNRYCDLSQLDSIQLTCVDVAAMANRRRAFNPNNIKVKSAIFANSPLAYGIARMYEQLLASPRIEVHVWDNPGGAAEWLGVPPDKLTFAVRPLRRGEGSGLTIIECQL